MRSVSAMAGFVVISLAAGRADAQTPTPTPRRAPPPTPAVATTITDQRDVRMYARLMAMTDARRLDRGLVDSALASRWNPLRAAAALGAGQLGPVHGRASAMTLRSLLGDRDLTVASNAAYSLGLLLDTGSVSALAGRLSGQPGVAREAAWALGEIGAPARAAITSALARPGTDEATTIQLLLAAAKLRPVPVQEVRPYLLIPGRPSVVWAAAYAIARTRAPAGVRDLIALAGSGAFATTRPDVSRPRISISGARTGGTAAEVYVAPLVAHQRTRSEIARALAKTATGDSLADAGFAVLGKLASDPHPHVRINAIRSIATFDKRGHTAVVAAARDINANVRIAAAQSLGPVLDSSLAMWTALWQSDTSLMFRSSLLASAARARAPLPALSAWMSHDDWRFRVAALNAAGSSPDSQAARRTAMSGLRDSDGRVRAAAYGLLTGADTAVPPAEVHTQLIAGLRDSDFVVRATVLGGLARHATAADAPAVLASYALSAGDSSNDARVAAVGYLAAAWRRDSASFSEALRARVKGLPAPADPLVRAAAAGATAFGAWPSAFGNPRPLAWYENVVRTYVLTALSGRPQLATISTRRGDIVIELFGADAPITVWNFMNLARTGYYGRTAFHRVVPNFVAQDGDPRGDGNGGPGYAIRDEMNPRRYDRGALGMALSGPDTGGSQYFITHSPQPHLDGHYTVFGRVLRGYEALDAIVQGDRILKVTAR